MKLRIEESEICYEIYEDGVNTDRKIYELIGFIPKVHPVLSIAEGYSGLIEFDELEQIYNFMKSLDANGGKTE